MPAVVVLENVPGFALSLAGELVVSNLKRIGYQLFTTVLQPNTEWGEIEDRKRWLLIATLDRPFFLSPPASASVTPLSAYLDPPDAFRDQADAERIARTIEGLRAHNARHQDLGHGFASAYPRRTASLNIIDKIRNSKIAVLRPTVFPVLFL